MFHQHREGELIRYGFSVMRADDGKLYGFAFNLFRRMIGVFDWGYSRWWLRLDLELDHKMYRPNDVDSMTSMMCRRCGLFVSEAPNTCKGKSWMWGTHAYKRA